MAAAGAAAPDRRGRQPPPSPGRPGSRGNQFVKDLVDAFGRLRAAAGADVADGPNSVRLPAIMTAIGALGEAFDVDLPFVQRGEAAAGAMHFARGLKLGCSCNLIISSPGGQKL